MDLLLVFGVLFVAFWGVYATCLLWRRYQTEQAFEAKKQLVFAGVIYGGVLLTMTLFMGLGGVVPVPSYAFLMLASVGLVCAVTWWPNVRSWFVGLPVLCCIGTLVFAFGLPFDFAWYECILYALFWSVFVGLFVLFDQVPCCSVLQSFIWGLAAVIAFVLRIPLFFAMLGSSLWIVLWSLSKVMVKWQTPNLGNCAAVLVGFLWGGLFTFALMHNAILPVVLMLNCYIFAMTFGLFLLRQVSRQLNCSYIQFYQSLPPKAQVLTVNAILTRCGLLSVLGVLLWHMQDMYMSMGFCVIILIVFLDLYNRIKDGGAPAPSIRQVISSMVEGIKVGVQSGKQALTAQEQGHISTTESSEPTEKPQRKKTARKETKRRKK